MLNISIFIVPTIITLIICVGLIEKKEVFNLFCIGAKDGLNTLLKMFPTLIGIFLAVGMVNKSGLMEFLSNKLFFLAKSLKIPSEIIPLILLKPISGSASMAYASSLMEKFGVDSKIGLLAGTIMSSSETTFYVIAIYLSAIKIKKSGKLLVASIVADIICILVAIIIFNKYYV